MVHIALDLVANDFALCGHLITTTCRKEYLHVFKEQNRSTQQHSQNQSKSKHQNKILLSLFWKFVLPLIRNHFTLSSVTAQIVQLLSLALK